MWFYVLAGIADRRAVSATDEVLLSARVEKLRNRDTRGPFRGMMGRKYDSCRIGS